MEWFTLASQYGFLPALLVSLIFVVIKLLDILKSRQPEASPRPVDPPSSTDAVTNKDILEAVLEHSRELEKALGNMQSDMTHLREQHDRVDANGAPVWYVPAGLKDAIDLLTKELHDWREGMSNEDNS